MRLNMKVVRDKVYWKLYGPGDDDLLAKGVRGYADWEEAEKACRAALKALASCVQVWDRRKY